VFADKEPEKERLVGLAILLTAILRQGNKRRGQK